MKTRGLVQIYTGDGKGKTTAALGLAIRASGQGLRVCFIQFLKGIFGGEHFFVSQHHAFDIIQISTGDLFTKSIDRVSEEAKQTLEYAEERMLNSEYDLLILDEVFIAIQYKLISVRQILELIDKKPESLELILTGRNAPEAILERADLVTEMRKIRHPFEKSIHARVGIEY
ncbi:MAG: cob(I)yrinic acid a,c-diamide adenosyltransferase [Dehalococcoidales bacterium]|nr:cob(I)yrinic acid a,c-diamide adenosyltransferase [Dehalococcoidales bacterium]